MIQVAFSRCSEEMGRKLMGFVRTSHRFYKNTPEAADLISSAFLWSAQYSTLNLHYPPFSNYLAEDTLNLALKASINRPDALNTMNIVMNPRFLRSIKTNLLAELPGILQTKKLWDPSHVALISNEIFAHFSTNEFSAKKLESILLTSMDDSKFFTIILQKTKFMNDERIIKNVINRIIELNSVELAYIFFSRKDLIEEVSADNIFFLCERALFGQNKDLIRELFLSFKVFGVQKLSIDQLKHLQFIAALNNVENIETSIRIALSGLMTYQQATEIEKDLAAFPEVAIRDFDAMSKHSNAPRMINALLQSAADGTSLKIMLRNSILMPFVTDDFLNSELVQSINENNLPKIRVIEAYMPRISAESICIGINLAVRHREYILLHELLKHYERLTKAQIESILVIAIQDIKAFEMIAGLEYVQGKLSSETIGGLFKTSILFQKLDIASFIIDLHKPVDPQELYISIKHLNHQAKKESTETDLTPNKSILKKLLKNEHWVDSLIKWTISSDEVRMGNLLYIITRYGNKSQLLALCQAGNNVDVQLLSLERVLESMVVQKNVDMVKLIVQNDKWMKRLVFEGPNDRITTLFKAIHNLLDLHFKFGSPKESPVGHFSNELSHNYSPATLSPLSSSPGSDSAHSIFASSPPGKMLNPLAKSFQLPKAV